MKTLAAEYRALGNEDFRRRYPHAFLLIKNSPAAETADMGPKTVFTLLVGEDSEDGRGRLPKEAIPVVKTARNVFEKKITVGRAKNNDIVIRSPKISKVHAVIERKRDGIYYLSDMGSTNGTRINGERLARKTTIKLNSGDEVKFCRHEFEFLELDVFVEVIKKFY